MDSSNGENDPARQRPSSSSHFVVPTKSISKEFTSSSPIISCTSSSEISIPNIPSSSISSSGEFTLDSFNDLKSDNLPNAIEPTSVKPSINVLEMLLGKHPLPQIKKKLPFSSGNPSIELVQGIVHLYNEHPQPGSSTAFPSKNSKIICIIAVPTWMSLGDLTDFFGPDFLQKMDGIRVLADNSPNKYMVILKFKEHKYALNFVDEFHGKSFSFMSENGKPELCCCAFVKYVDFIKPIGKSRQDSLASTTLFPYGEFTNPSLIEIPTCPVCLERLDSAVSGLLTILCNHTFHCNCLIQWREDNTCPVCRFTQQPIGSATLCAKCGTADELWICLICGHVGCSRYQESHAYTHYKDTLHNYALELSTQRVWDYAGDGYVHRLIQNKNDGKLIEFPAPNNSMSRSVTDEDKEGLQKQDAIHLEYQYLMTAQLDTQRVFFEQKMREYEEIRSRQFKEMEQQQKAMKEQIQKLTIKSKQLESDNEATMLSNAEKDKTIRELEDQLRDLMLNFEARRAIGKEGELADGQVFMLANPDSKIASASSSSSSSSHPTPVKDALKKKLIKKQQQQQQQQQQKK